jgi:hypothetical protein
VKTVSNPGCLKHWPSGVQWPRSSHWFLLRREKSQCHRLLLRHSVSDPCQLHVQRLIATVLMRWAEANVAASAPDRCHMYGPTTRCRAVRATLDGGCDSASVTSAMNRDSSSTGTHRDHFTACDDRVGLCHAGRGELAGCNARYKRQQGRSSE